LLPPTGISGLQMYLFFAEYAKGIFCGNSSLLFLIKVL
jgi:hypothetical protein